MAAKWFPLLVLGVLIFSVAVMCSSSSSSAAAAASENVQNRVPEEYGQVLPPDVWVINDSLKALVEPTQSNTYLLSFDDGTVQAWKTKLDSAVWSFSSGPPLTSFRWFPKLDSSSEEEEEVEDDEGNWNVEGPEVSIEDDGSLSVHNALNQTKQTLKITLEDLRQGIVHVRNGEIIQVDRQTTMFLVDPDTGAITQELWNGNTEDLKLGQDKKSLFFIRTDYTARASNFSGNPLWSLSYGEIGVLVLGLEKSQEVASLSLLPKMPTASPGVPFKIAPPKSLPAPPPMRLPAASLQHSGPKTTMALESGQSIASGHLALPAAPVAPPPLPQLKPALALWEQHGNSDGYSSGWPYSHAPGMLGAPKPTPKTNPVVAAAIALLMFAIVGVIIKIFAMTKEESPTPPAKKRKARKLSSNGKEILTAAASQDSDVLTKETRIKLQEKYGNGTQVGRLFVTNVLVGSGSNGTLVLEGYLDDRKVAVKRLLAQYYEKAQKEIALLIASDEHPNVVRYYATEETADFVYVALERCSFSLYDLILAQTSQGAGMEKQVKECLAGKGLKLRSVEDFKLWDERGRPSSQLFQVMRDIVSGLAHLHIVGIVHRDLKPHNVLISSGRIMQAKIADMGLSKQLDDDAMSFDTQLTGHGSSGSRGWQAPEQLLKGRGSRAVDIFSLGCVLYHCITGGKHPFGSHLERDGNIAFGKMDLFHIIDFPEATDLIQSLLDPNPVKRPPAQDIMLHPFFWDGEKRMAFLKDASDRVELDMKDAGSVLLADIESLEPTVLCGGWDGKLDFPLLQNIRGYRRYNFKSVRDLLRVIRNKANHFRELPENLQTLLGSVPDGIDDYFTTRFPRLLIEIYHVVGHHCRSDPSFEKYYSVSYTPKFQSLEKG